MSRPTILLLVSGDGSARADQFVIMLRPSVPPPALGRPIHPATRKITIVHAAPRSVPLGEEGAKRAEERVTELRADLDEAMAMDPLILALCHVSISPKIAHPPDEAMADQPLAHAMQCLQIELRGRFGGDESHRRALHCLGNRLCIAEVVLLFL